jgi:proline iminopeptidase
LRSTTLVLLLVAPACALRAQSTALTRPIHTDSSRLAVRGGEIWYRVVGGGAGTPLILVHGGPGLPSVYLKSLEALADERLVVRYDQLGAGKSDVVQDTSLFNIGHYVEELETLRRHLGLERVHLYGHSWGSIVVLEYYRAHSQHVASLVLASDVLDMPAFFGNLRRIFSTFPDSMYRAVQRQDASQPYDTVAFRAAMKEFGAYSQRTMLPADADTMKKFQNPAIADYMNGTSVFTPNGTLRDYDATPFLRQVNVPVLFTVGEFDFVGPDIVRRHASLTPDARLVVIPAAAHMTQWDNALANTEAVRTFLREVDARR